MSAASARKVLLVGLGSPDRGDDGIGAFVAERLRGRLPNDVAIILCQGDVLSLIAEWADFDAVICIDAAAAIAAPGRIHRFDLTTNELPREGNFASSHSMGFAEAVSLARVLGQAPQEIIVYAIEAATFTNGAAITPGVAAVAGEVATRIVADVERLRYSQALPPCSVSLEPPV